MSEERNLHDAARYGSVSAIKAALEKNKVDAKDDKKGYLNAVKFLLERGAKRTAKDKCKRDCVFLAVMKQKKPVAEFLLSKGLGDINSRDHKGRTSLHYICEDEGMEMMRFVLRNCPKLNLDIKDADGKTPLMICCANEFEYGIRNLLGKGADVDVQDSQGFSCLMYMLKMGADVELVKLLLGSKPKLNLKTKKEKKTALMLGAVSNNRKGVRAILETARVDADLQDAKGQTALHLLCLLAPANYRMIRLLLQKGKANPNILNTSGKAPLHLGFPEGMRTNPYDNSEGNSHKRESILMLLRYGADGNLKSKDGKAAIIKGYPPVFVWGRKTWQFYPADFLKAAKTIFIFFKIRHKSGRDVAEMMIEYAARNAWPEKAKKIEKL